MLTIFCYLAPTQPPSWSVMPSSQPTTTVAPSAQPTQLPEPLPLVIWYSQTVVYGVVFNDTRRPTDDEIFQW